MKNKSLFLVLLLCSVQLMWCPPKGSKSNFVKRKMIFDEEDEEYVLLYYKGFDVVDAHTATAKEIEIYEKSCEKHGVIPLRERYFADVREDLYMMAKYGVDYAEYIYDDD